MCGRSPAGGAEPAGMTMSPAELRHERPGRGLLGYRRTEVDRLLVEATVAYEAVWRERADLQDLVHELQQEVTRHREGEQAMRNALVTAERAADEMRASASRQAELIVREAGGLVEFTDCEDPLGAPLDATPSSHLVAARSTQAPPPSYPRTPRPTTCSRPPGTPRRRRGPSPPATSPRR